MNEIQWLDGATLEKASKSRYDRRILGKSYKYFTKWLNQSVSKKQSYALILSNQAVLIGSEFSVMKAWKQGYKEYRIDEMIPTDLKIGIPYGHYKSGAHLDVTITTLEKLIERN